ncbi:MAG: hypothetical protein AAFY69_06420 [Pseudomonadota bacterium]
MQRILIFTLGLAGTVLGGCGTANPCESRVDYQRAAEARPLEVPEGYDSLPPEAKLDIPTASTPPDVDQSCLEKPPRFFEDGEGEGEGDSEDSAG